MTKIVVESRQVAHLWANQSQEQARNAQGNFSFCGRVIKSYNTPIAQLCENGVVLRDTYHYSNTTCKHQSLVHQSLSASQRLFSISVDNAGACDRDDHVKNHEAMVRDYEATLKAAAKPRIRPVTVESHLEHAKEIRIKANDYRQRFCKGAFKQCPLIPENTSLVETLENLRKRDAKQLAKKAKAKAEQEKADAEEARLDLEHWIAIGLPAWKQNKSWAARGVNTTDCDDWWKTTVIPPSAPVDFRVIKTDAESYKPDVEFVETTLGAEFPKSHCARAFKAILACRKAKKGWKRNGSEVRVGLFQIDEIDEHGNVTAGCHVIRWEEIEAFAKELGLLTESGLEARTDGFSRSDLHSV